MVTAHLFMCYKTELFFYDKTQQDLGCSGEVSLLSALKQVSSFVDWAST